jgi:hypothetical protein
MASNKSTTGRSKSSSAKRTSKKPIPIDGGTSSQGASTSNNTDHASVAQDYPGMVEEIRLRAYELYEQRGRQEGRHEDDWTRAEVEIMAKYNKAEKSA